MSVKPLAVVRDVTGSMLHLGLAESVGDIKVTDNEIVLTINRAKTTSARGYDFRVTKRGVSLYRFIRTTDGKWYMTEPITSWFFADEYHRS